MQVYYKNPHAIKSITEKLDKASLVEPKHYMEDGSVTHGAIEGVKMALDSDCNFDCSMCGRDKNNTAKMSFDFFKRITKEMKEFGVKNFGLFFDNEPFIHTQDSLVPAIKYLKEELGVPYVFITTNGSACTKKNLEAVFRAGLDSLKFSLNSATPEQFAVVTNKSENMFHTILNNLKNAKKIRDTVFVETGKYCGLFASSINFVKDQSAELKPLLETHVFPYVDEWYMLPEYQMGGEESTLNSMRKAGFDKPIAGNTGRLGVERAALPCWAVMNSSHILANGDVYACCFPAPVKGQIMGNLHNASFEEVINGAFYKALRKAHLAKDVTNTVCEKCIAYN